MREMRFIQDRWGIQRIEFKNQSSGLFQDSIELFLIFSLHVNKFLKTIFFKNFSQDERHSEEQVDGYRNPIRFISAAMRFCISRLTLRSLLMACC
jgi:hypothetical protein